MKTLSAALFVAGALGSTAALAAALPTKIGQCSTTTVSEVTSRLVGQAESGSAIVYENGGRQVSYSTVDGIENSEPGDRVKLCLTWIPEDCPPGDDRGRVYSAMNLRTGEFWEEPDSAHSCGGA